MLINSKERIHPHMFTLWVSMGSVIMMFAGLTSALIVKKNQSAWINIEIPYQFYFSTIILLSSSGTIYLAKRFFNLRNMHYFRMLSLITILLSFFFIVNQFYAFSVFENNNLHVFGRNSNGFLSFLGVTALLHILHVLGGVVALSIMVFKAYYSSVKTYSNSRINILSTYWHFVDILWVYLFLFFLFI